MRKGKRLEVMAEVWRIGNAGAGSRMISGNDERRPGRFGKSRTLGVVPSCIGIRVWSLEDPVEGWKREAKHETGGQVTAHITSW